jgi:hypothetical protein
MSVTTLLKEIAKITSSEELRVLNDALKAQHNLLSRRTAVSFNIGDTVSFTGRGKRTVTGTVKSVMVKNVKVDCGVNGIWNVGAGLLSKV